MIKKVILAIYAVVFFIAVVVGIWNRQTYTDITKQDDLMNNFYVAVLNDELTSNIVQRMEDELPNASIILKAKAEGEIKHMFKLNKQLVSVEEVYKGDGINKGDKIFIMAPNWRFYFDDMSINMGFVNLLEKDNEYLIFLKEKLETLDISDNNTYCLVDTIIAPIFNFNDKENTIVSIKDDNYYVPYSYISKNEFFVSTQGSIDKIEKLKHNLLYEYVK